MKGEMRTFGVVPNEPLHKFLIQFSRMQQYMGVIIDEFLLNGPVEPLTMGIQLGRFWIGMIVDQMKLFEFFRTMFLEFGAVVCQHIGKGIRENHAAIIKEFLVGQGDMGGGAPGKGKAGIQILKGMTWR